MSAVPALSRWSAQGVPPPLAPTRLGYGDVLLVPLHALRQSPWRPHVHMVLPPSPSRQPWPLRPELPMHSWSTRKTPLHMSFSPPHFELLPTLQGDAHQASRTKTKSTVGSSHTVPSEKTSTNDCSSCLLYPTKHLGLPFRNRTRRLRACMFLVFGRCIRLASSFTANCSSHLS